MEIARLVTLVAQNAAMLVFCVKQGILRAKNNVSKIPQVRLIMFSPHDSMKVNVDSPVIIFNLTDGDADIGNDTASGIWLKDSRYDSLGFTRTDFPKITDGIEDPNKGLSATVYFFPVYPAVVPRSDSIHMLYGDTLTYQFYVTDRAGHKSNIITTHPLIIRP